MNEDERTAQVLEVEGLRLRVVALEDDLERALHAYRSARTKMLKGGAA